MPDKRPDKQPDRAIKNHPDEERRVAARRPEIRQDDGGGSTLVGYAAVFGKPSDELGWWDTFVETIERGAFDSALARDDLDVRCLFNHDDNFVLGRTKSGTLSLEADETGLRYEAKLPETGLEHVKEAVKRGDVDQSSFAFTIRKDQWEHVKDGPDIRTIIDVDELFDVSPVTYPAYPDTTVALRSRTRSGVATTTSTTVVADDGAKDEETEALKREIENLKRENEGLKAQRDAALKQAKDLLHRYDPTI